MKTLINFAICLLFSQSGMAQYNSDNLSLPTNTETIDLYTFENLRIIPILANNTFKTEFKDVGNFRNLKHAIETDGLEVTEVDRSGTVNTLFAQNSSKDTVYIMAGEVVKGGKQDRIIGQDVVIAPGEKLNLSAFCVEQGRWTNSSSKGDNGNDKFDGYYNVSSKEVRKAAIVNKNQSTVWSKVAETTSENDATSGTSTYTALENSKEYKDAIAKYMSRFQSLWDNDERVVGVVAASGNEVIGADIFATHDLFANAYNNLLHSYCTDAMTNGSEVKISTEDIQKYLAQFLANEDNQEKALDGKGSLFKHKNRTLHLTTF